MIGEHIQFVIIILLVDVPVFGILVLSGFILLPVLLPVAVTDDGGKKQETSKGTFNELDKLSMGNITVRSILHNIFVQQNHGNFPFIQLISRIHECPIIFLRETANQLLQYLHMIIISETE